MSHAVFTLHTQRLLLRELTADDVPALASILADPQVMRYSVRGVMSAVATAEFVQECQSSSAAYGYAPWALIERDSGALVGFCGLVKETVDGAEEVGLGYRLAPSFWGQGYATEAVQATLQHAFQTLGLASVIAIVQPQNSASVAVIRKSAFKDFVHSQYHRIGVRIYRLSRAQWEA